MEGLRISVPGNDGFGAGGGGSDVAARRSPRRTPTASSPRRSPPRAAAAAADIPSDFECSLCLRLFYEPVSIACGHSYCRGCLRRALRFKASCPICRAPLHAGAADAAANLAMVSFIQRDCAAEYAARAREAAADAAEEAAAAKRALTLGEDATLLPDGSVQMEVFVDRYSLVFPGQPITLFVYEPQYVIMVTRCLSGGRRFVMQRAAERGSVGTVVQIDDARMLGGGQYLLQAHGVGRCVCVSALVAEPEAHGLRSASIVPLDDDDDAPDGTAADAALPRDVLAVAHEAAEVLEGLFDSFDQRTMTSLLRKFGEPPRPTGVTRGASGVSVDAPQSLSYYRNVSYWLASALASHIIGGEAQRAALFACTSLASRVSQTAALVARSDANPAVAPSARRLARGRRRLLDLGFSRHMQALGSVGGSCLLLLAIFAGLLAWTYVLPSMAEPGRAAHGILT